MSSKGLSGEKRLALSLSAAFLALTLLLGVLAYVVIGLRGDNVDSTSEDSQTSIESVSEDSLPDDSATGSPDSGQDGEPSPDDSQQEMIPDDVDDVQQVFYNVPDEMRAVQIVAGSDYMTSGETEKAALASQIDRAVNAAAEYTMNTIVIDTKYKDGVMFKSDILSSVQTELDCVDYMVSAAREKGLYVYATYDVSDIVGDDGGYAPALGADGDTLDIVYEAAGAFAKKYKLDGIVLTGYYVTADAQSYAAYLESGAGSGYDNYMQEIPRALISTATSAIRKQAPGTQVGLLTSAVWQNLEDDEAGSQTSAPFTDMGTGNADTRDFVLKNLVDFVMVQNYGSTGDASVPFTTVAEWWAKLAGESGVSLYMVQASDKAVTQNYGWGAAEQLTKQVIELDKISEVTGSVFNSLRALMANPGNSTTTLVQYMNDQIDEDYVLTQLTMQKPSQLTFTTREQIITFQGASDPQVKVTLNGEAIPTSDSGYFSINEELDAGLNTFLFEHKDRKITYNITRQVEVLKEVTPVGSIQVEGGMQITITALAYADASVSASIGGQTLKMSITEAEDDEVDRDSGYKLFACVYTAPAATSSDVNVGTISVTATAQGTTKTLQGASITVNKVATMGEGSVVRVVADQAETFPTSTLNNNSSAAYYPLPQGTVDMTYGQEVIYKSGKQTYSYWQLQSGVRVYSSDIQAISGGMASENVISDMSVKSSGQYTLVTLATREKVPYTVSYDGTNIVFRFKYTTTVPSSTGLDTGNVLFSNASWNDANLSLTFRKNGGFLGYRAYYDGNNLILRFNNSPGTLSGARIVVDPGHGGNDPGASGFYPGRDEADINLAVAQKLTSELKSRGASVLMTTPGSTMATRLAAARAFNAHVLVSVHCNSSATNSAATGTEVYYFYNYQSPLASYISSNVASALGTSNRGAKAGLYYMTRESQISCVLAEIGFVSNEGEYTKLINSSYQNNIAQAIANGINSYFGYTYSGVKSGTSSGSSGSGSSVTLPSSGGASSGGTISSVSTSSSTSAASSSKPSSSSTGGVINKTTKVTGVSLDYNDISLNVGESTTLKATVTPSTATTRTVGWESSNLAVATVSTSGKITGKKKGTATITVYTTDGNFEDTCTVHVGGSSGSGDDEEKLIDDIYIEGDKSVEVGSRVILEAVISPTDAFYPSVTWSISNTSIAKFMGTPTSDQCKIEGLKKGTVTVTAKADDDSGVKSTFKLTVGSPSDIKDEDDDDEDVVEPVKGVLVKEITIKGKETVEVGTRVEYEAEVSPANAEDTGVKWSIEGGSGVLSIYSVTNEKAVRVEALKKGTAYLVAKAYDEGRVTAKLKITVTS